MALITMYGGEVQSIHVVRARGTDGFTLLAVHTDDSERQLGGWYGGQGEAADAARENYTDNSDTVLIGGEDDGAMWPVDTWLYDSARADVGADTTDTELDALVATYAEDAEKENIIVEGDILDYLKQVRAEKQDDE